MRRDQLRSLAALRQHVTRARQERDEIITDNTLVQIKAAASDRAATT
ncbi:hypothetical protein [Streptomyces sp. NBC_00158]